MWTGVDFIGPLSERETLACVAITMLQHSMAEKWLAIQAVIFWYISKREL